MSHFNLHYLPLGGIHITYWLIWFEHCGYMWHTCLPNVSQSHVIRRIGWFNIVINLHHHVSLKRFSDLTMCKTFSKWFSGENIVILSLSVIPIIVMVGYQKWLMSAQIDEPVHEISNNVVCATSKGSDQPVHTQSDQSLC